MSDDFRPRSQWPRLLAGPMVRRVTPTKAYIFIATKMAANAHLVLYSGRVAHNTGAAPIFTGAGAPVALDRIGRHLFVGVLEATIPGTQAPGSTVSYDVVINDGTARGLNDLQLLGGAHVTDARRRAYPLGFEDGMLPSFVLPPADPADLQIAHGSCRKPHGGGNKEPDAFQLLDASIAAAIRGDAGVPPRPQQLILTGDQVYADDVAPALLQALSAAGDELLGWSEDLPLIDPDTDFIVQPGWRTRYLSIRDVDLKEMPEDGAADYSQSHLLKFGEWVAMYLFTWSDALWPLDNHGEYDLPQARARLPVRRINQVLGLADTVGLIVIPARAARAMKVADWLTEFADRLEVFWNETRGHAVRYGKSVRTTRRVLANCATYTMFDDHEITDDWYVSKRVHDELKGTGARSPHNQVGPRMLRNGLSAYAIFQHWGNVPDDFGPGTHGRTLLQKWRFISPSAGCELKTSPRDADRILGVEKNRVACDDDGNCRPILPIPPSRQRGDFERFRWDYAIEFPAHRLLALDTRTWRFFPPGAPLSFSALAPLVPMEQGRPAQAGAAHIQAIADAWRQAGQTAARVTMRHYADMVDAYVDLAEARNASLAELRNKATVLFVKGTDFFNSLPGRAARAAADIEDPAIPFFASLGRYFDEMMRDGRLAASLGETTDELKQALTRMLGVATSGDFGPNSQDLTDVVKALGDYVIFAWRGSIVGMVHAAHRFSEATGRELWTLFTTQAASGTVFNQLGSALVIGLDALDDLAAATGLDAFARTIFRNGANRLAPGLICKEALPFMVTGPLQGVDVNKPTFILSPAPIFGNRTVELIQRIALVKAMATGLPGEEELDFEPWTGNMAAMINLFEAARTLRCAVVLSGDVHYSGSSVVNVDTAHASTRYVQLTSSSMRNSDKKTRGLAMIDDLIYGPDSGNLLFQADWAGFTQTGSPSRAHLMRIARSEIEQSLDRLNPVDAALDSYQDFQAWLQGPTISLQDIAAMAFRAAVSIPNTAGELVSEAAWQFYSAIENIVDFSNDPLMKIFGDYLTAPAPLVRQLHDFYEEVGLDPANGLKREEFVLKDHRTDRLAAYPLVEQRLASLPRTAEMMEHHERRTVGHANLGYISLVVRDGQVREVRHELRWYPFDEAARIAHVAQDPIPRLDWYGTLHRAGWTGNSPDPGLHRP